jgi:hypothetical protein
VVKGSMLVGVEASMSELEWKRVYQSWSESEYVTVVRVSMPDL